MSRFLSFSTPKALLLGVLIASSQNAAVAQIGNQVTEMVTDFNGYWQSGISNVNAVKPINSHNLLAFTYDGVRYSTGVNDAVLTSNGLSFVARKWYAVPVNSLPGTLTSNTKLGLGALYDGVNPGPSVPPPSGSLPYYLMDGLQGLDIGTGLANLPVGQLVFDVANLQLGAIGNGIPDILITQFASPPTVVDRYSFRDASNNIVGNEVSINLSALNVLGNWTADFYEVTPTRMLTAGFTNTDRPLRMWCADLSAFGLNAGNIGSVQKFVIQLSGDSDIGFVAYCSAALSVVPPDLPGGVDKQPSLWLKANAGTNTLITNTPLSDWSDQSGRANNAGQTNASLRPNFMTQGINFNPTVNFGAQYMNTFQNLTDGNGNPYSTFVVFQQQNAAVAKNLLGSTGASCTTCVRQNVAASTGSLSVMNGAANVFPSGTAPAVGTVAKIWSVVYAGAAGNRLLTDMRTDQTSSGVYTFTNRPSQIGSHSNAVPAGSSNISEVITYPYALTVNEVQRINSYLAVKYGISLNTNYLSCGSAVLFESDGPGTTYLYDSRITGIGRASCQQLNQKQSKNVEAGALVTIGAGNSVAADNISNTAILPDNSYLLAGDNNAAITWGSGTVGGIMQSRMARTWKVAKTGNPGEVKIQVPASSSTETAKLQALPANALAFMLVKNTADFSAGYTSVLMTAVGSNFEVSYDFAPGDYFTFAYFVPNPLPVTLLSFHAVPDPARKSVNLRWVTASETNNDFFTIEKSSDAAHWFPLGRQNGAGNSNTQLSYEMEDTHPLEGTSYYRLKQTDFDGTESIEGIRSVDFSLPPDFEIYPNPATDRVHVKGKSIVRLELFDVSGKPCHTESRQETGTWVLDLSAFARGVYYLRVTTEGNRSATEKLVLR